ncbi:MAG TPA: recombinase family protein [Nocardioidaceae bacterium]|nr:recombinase family protein [Nocardioidaceae bacterium]
MTGTNRERPGLREALAACREGDTLVVTKLDRLARSSPDARADAGERAHGCSSVPSDLSCTRPGPSAAPEQAAVDEQGGRSPIGLRRGCVNLGRIDAVLGLSIIRRPGQRVDRNAASASDRL